MLLIVLNCDSRKEIIALAKTYFAIQTRKQELINNEIYKKIKDYSKNRSDLQTYYNVGKMLSEAGKHYGEGIIKEYSKKLTNELGKGYTQSRLRYFRRFYVIF